jgi:ribosome-associated protein
MPRALEGARKSTPPAELVHSHGSDALLAHVLAWLDEAKAENVVAIDIRQKSSLGDYMVIASGRSDRHVGAVAEQIQRKLKDEGLAKARIEGQSHCDWVVIDIGDIIVHVFRPEVREFYNLEKMWSGERPNGDQVTH